MTFSRPLLLNPGPVTLSERVRQSLLLPDLCHREAEFFDLQDEIRARLLGVYALSGDWAAVPLTGSGTAAVEAMIASLVPKTGRLLVIENGVYGERIGRIAAIQGLEYETLQHDWLAPVDLQRLDRRLSGDARFSHVAVVHHETTTGRLNDLAAIDRICIAHGADLLVDAVSSFGAEAIDFDGNVVAVAAAANKCLHGTPGASFVIARRAALERAETRSLYLDLAGWCRAQDARGTPFTPAVYAYYALREALREFDEAGGWKARHAAYRQLADQTAAGFAALDIEPLIALTDSSVVLRAYRLPIGLSYPSLHDILKLAGFIIYAGQGNLAEGMFRISTMGAITSADINRLLKYVGEIAASACSPLPKGDGL